MIRNGWITLNRSIQDSAIWQSDEPFDVRSAWIDLIMMANFADREILYKGRNIMIRRGQVRTSVRKLAARWRWSKDKVSRHLSALEARHSVTLKCDTDGTLITIINYGKYQDGATPTATPTGHRQGHKPDTDKDENNNGRKKAETKKEEPAYAEEDDDDGLPAEEARRKWQASMNSNPTTPSA